MYLFKLVFSFCSTYIPRSGTARSYGSSISSFLSNLHTVFHSDCTNLHSHQQCMSSLFPTPSPIFIYTLFDKSFWPVWWHFIVVFICISLIISDVEHLFMCLLATGHRWPVFRSSAHFFIGLFVFLILSCMSCLYIFHINPLLVIPFANIFSHSVGCLFVSLMVSFAETVFSPLFILAPFVVD